MSQGSAARLLDDIEMIDETTRAGSVPTSEQARYEPRFRVVTRKPLVPSRRPARAGSLARVVMLTAVPGLALLVYVIFWTLAMRGGYYKDHLQAQLRAGRIEERELRADKRRLQSPGLILDRATKDLGMKPADRREYAKLPPLKPAAR